MSEQNIMVCVAMISLAAVNIAALKYLDIWGCFVTAASVPLADKLIKLISSS